MDEREFLEERAQRREYLEEDEINLLDLVIPLFKHKWLIVCIVFLAGAGAVAYSLLATEMYRSQAVVIPVEQERTSLGGQLRALGGLGGMAAQQIGIGGSGSLEKFQVVLKSRELTNNLIESYQLLPLIFKDAWDAEQERWIVEEPPTVQDGYEALQQLLEVDVDQRNNVLTVGFVSDDPVFAKLMVERYIEGMSEFLRGQELENVAAQRQTLERQLALTEDPLLRAKLADIVAQYVEREMLTTVQKYYGFNVMDSPFVPEKRFKPKRAQICLLSVIAAFFVAVFLAFIMEFAENLKRNDPERLAELKRHIKPW